MSKFKKIKKSVTLDESLVYSLEDDVIHKRGRSFSQRIEFLIKLGLQKEKEIGNSI